MEYNIVCLKDNPRLLNTATEWFSSKWSIPKSAYYESISLCIKNIAAVPRWYLVLNSSESIIAGLGVIENDFHKLVQLSPNICAVFVEKEFRGHGIAKAMLDFVCKDMADSGFDDIYLITDHTQFYEKCGFEFLCPVEENSGEISRMYHRRLKSE